MTNPQVLPEIKLLLPLPKKAKAKNHKKIEKRIEKIFSEIRDTLGGRGKNPSRYRWI